MGSVGFVEEEEEGPALEADAANSKEGDKTGIHFVPISYQATYEEDDYTRLLMVVLHLPNGIKDFRITPNTDGTKLMITGVAPQLVADVDHMVGAKMLKNSFEIRGIKDALLALRRPQSVYVRLFAEVELIEPVDRLSKVPYCARIDPKSHAQTIIYRLKCINSKAADLKTEEFKFEMNSI
jgi:hypothetical protein